MRLRRFPRKPSATAARYAADIEMFPPYKATMSRNSSFSTTRRLLRSHSRNAQWLAARWFFDREQRRATFGNMEVATDDTLGILTKVKIRVKWKID